ncbi:TetR/AcrR family transcriptional regulator [Blastococcus jejuensis]|uniref:TetR/AcrR family transcriptional regulator n=1 Tax=Blastococcus jejuensis TaxID=351224 RepID=A0ABP6NWW9_9ACTN
MTTRLTRPQQVERNRTLLLDAARRTFLARGYAGATIDAIAEEAGFSKGVVYSQFAGKADLFLTLLEQRIVDRAAENGRLVAEHSGPDALRSLLRTSARRSRHGSDWGRLLIEFRLVAAHDPELNARYRVLHDRTIDLFAETVTAALARDGLAPAYPARTFAQLVLALDTGVVLERAADPDALPLELAEHVLARLVAPG